MNTDESDSGYLLAQKAGHASEQEPQQEPAFERMVEQGLADADAGRTLSNAAMREQIASWHS